MALFEELKQSVLLQHEQCDFPDRLLAVVLEIAANPGRYAGKEQLVETLVMQIRGYNPYAGVGCFYTSFGVKAIRKTVRKLSP